MNERLDVTNHTSVALPARQATYGIATGVQSTREAAARLTFLERLSYFNAEYFKGILFVLASALFIVAVPLALMNRGRLMAMINRTAKRSLDLFGAIVGLILTLPVWLVIPLVIKLTSPGPVFYTQVRIGENRRRRNRRTFNRADISESRRTRERRRENLHGRPFQVIKFRTMVNDAEKSTGPVWATKNDPRVTKLGTFLRKTRIDEIPQFLNVLRGEMSIVGPRPERPHFVKDLATKVEDYTGRLQVKPGVTGLAQIETGYDSSLTSVAEKVKCDLEYIQTSSVWTDVMIMLRTVKVVFTGKGAC
jgi:lipopolysaccharide/colanic/teichoic acid biosynthesis glycosyltransferase